MERNAHSVLITTPTPPLCIEFSNMSTPPPLPARLCREHPNKAIASFTGSLEVSLKPGGGAASVGVHGDVDGAASSTAAAGGGGSRKKSRTVVKEPVTPENLLLRGTVLRNTKVCCCWCCRCVLL